MGLINKYLKRTPVYNYLKYFHNKKIATQWTNHDQEMFDFYSQFVSDDDLVFDVGANIGNRTKIFLRLNSMVVAVEPQDECVNILNTFFGKHEKLTIIQKVLGSAAGEAELMISRANTLSTLSTDWVKAVKSSGRFSNYSWDDKKTVQMVTLDHLIELYGVPSFIKIDVEGFEYEVISGLSTPINYISLEFAPENFKSTFKCIDHLESLGKVIFNYSLGESMTYELESFVSSKEIKNILNKYQNDYEIFGDVYCQYVGN